MIQETSFAAERSITRAMPTLRERVLTLLKQNSRLGMTDEEMQAHLGMNPSTQRPRRIELVKAGFVFDSGETRNTNSGRKAIVYKAK